MIETLTRQVRHRLQLLLPVLGDPDGFLLASLSLRRHALLVCVVQDPVEELWVQRMEYIKKVLARWPFPCWVLIGEVPAQQIILSELRVEVLHREFLVMRHLDIIYVRLLDQLLLVREHCLQEVLVNQGGRGR